MRFFALLALVAITGCGGSAPSAAAAEPTPPELLVDRPVGYVLPHGPESILVVVDRPRNPRNDYPIQIATQTLTALRHFTTDTQWKWIDEISPEMVERAGTVVYLGENSERRLRPAELAALHKASRLIVTSYHLDEIQSAGIAFRNIEYGGAAVWKPGAKPTVPYRSERFLSYDANYVELRANSSTRVLAYLEAQGKRVPYIVRDGNATFINGTLTFAHDLGRIEDNGAMLVVCDALYDMLDAKPFPEKRLAMLRLEDVSVQTPARRFSAIVRFLEAEGVPYGIALIPQQLIRGAHLSTLKQDPELVEALRWAQARHGRVILHGLHHSYNSSEDFEFWDQVHNRPLPNDSVDSMRVKLEAGIKTERDLGLEPIMWESPHYSSSPLDYRVVSAYFGASWERRRTMPFAPWVLDRDIYGARLLPENLGFISTLNVADATLAAQLQRAQKMTVCRACIAAAFMHPSTVHLADVVDFVHRMRAMGYTFVDPLELMRAQRAS